MRLQHEGKLASPRDRTEVCAHVKPLRQIIIESSQML